MTNNLCHKEPVTLPLRQKCFEAATERRASSLADSRTLDASAEHHDKRR